MSPEAMQVLSDALDEMASRCFLAASNKGFWESETMRCAERPELLELYKSKRVALMHSELSEQLEGLRKPGPDEHCPQFTKEEIELADLLIRAFDYAGGYSLRLGEAVMAKLTYNLSREYKHGKAF